MPIVIDDEEFSFEATGEKSKEKFVGKFRAKKCLSLEDHVFSDRRYRDILGGQNPSHASPLASNIAAIVAELSVRLTKAPRWWTELNDGLSLKDDNVLAEIYEAACAVETRDREARAKTAQQDVSDLRALKAAQDE